MDLMDCERHGQHLRHGGCRLSGSGRGIDRLRARNEKDASTSANAVSMGLEGLSMGAWRRCGCDARAVDCGLALRT